MREPAGSKVTHQPKLYDQLVTAAPNRYRSHDEDSARWLDFVYRPGDIVISTRSKSGTTWMQMLCALLVFRTATLPRPLGELSPWLDWLGVDADDLYSQLDAQTHRRIIKTHTPLDGNPLSPDALYIVVARHPLDAAASLYHQNSNIDRDRLAELTGNQSGGTTDRPRPSVAEWLNAWIDWDGPIIDGTTNNLDSLPGVMWHLSDAWARREEANVILVRYEDLLADLPAEMRRLATALDTDIDDATIAQLARAATFEEMRRHSDELAPDPGRILKSRAAFFRQGTSGAAAEVLSPDDVARYRTRIDGLAPASLVNWLHP